MSLLRSWSWWEWEEDRGEEGTQASHPPQACVSPSHSSVAEGHRPEEGGRPSRVDSEAGRIGDPRREVMGNWEEELTCWVVG